MTMETAAANANYGTTASGSSFYAAMRILPRDRREAIYEIYSFCRAVDDVADDGGDERRCDDSDEDVSFHGIPFWPFPPGGGRTKCRSHERRCCRYSFMGERCGVTP